MKIKAINTDQFGNKSTIDMELEHYLRAKKVQPDKFEPADKKSAEIINKIPMDVVPIGTTQKDVEEFERTRGSKKGKAKSRFEEMLLLVNAGKEIEVLQEENNYTETLNQVSTQIEAPEGYTSPNVDIKPGEIKSEKTDDDNQDDDKKDAADVFDEENKKIQAEENKSSSGLELESLKKLSLDQLQATVIAAGLPKGVTAQLLKLKNKEKLAQDYFKYASEKK